VTAKDVQRVNVDTTVQEKAVRFPTDTQLCHKAREELLNTAEHYDIEVRQSYVRKSKQAVFLANKYMAARQMNRGRKQIKKVRNYLGRVIRDLERAIDRAPSLEAAFRMIWPRHGKSTIKPLIQRHRTKSIPGMRRKWSVSPRARLIRGTSLAARPVSPQPMPATSLSEPWLIMGDLTMVIPCQLFSSRSQD